MVDEQERSGKGRATPSRKEAEAARRKEMKRPVTRREQAAVQRAKRSEMIAKRNEALKSGDEKYLPARDQGPRRRFVRDFVDARWGVAEWLMPLLLLFLGVSMVRPDYSTLAFFYVAFLATIDTVWLIVRLRKAMAARFEGGARGHLGYAVLRSSQMRVLRLPKPTVKRGQELPERY